MRERRVLMSKLHLSLRKILAKCLIWSVILYGSETWPIKTTKKRHLKCIEMYVWRKMMKVNWKDHNSNAELLRMIGEEMNIIKDLCDIS